jgi:phenylacetate-CoA ligase
VGEWGELVITTLTRECCPMIRYRTRDLTRLIPEPCTCGRTHHKLDRLKGRTDDMLIIRGVNVFPSQIEQVITQFPDVATHYQIVLTTKDGLDNCEVQIETVDDFPFDEIRKLEKLRNDLMAEFKSNLQIKVNVRIVAPNTIARSDGKAKRIIDKREGLA